MSIDKHRRWVLCVIVLSVAVRCGSDDPAAPESTVATEVLSPRAGTWTETNTLTQPDVAAIGVDAEGRLRAVADGDTYVLEAGALALRQRFAEPGTPTAFGAVRRIRPRLAGGAWIVTATGLWSAEELYVRFRPTELPSPGFTDVMEVGAGPLAGLWLAAPDGLYWVTETVAQRIEADRAPDRIAVSGDAAALLAGGDVRILTTDGDALYVEASPFSDAVDVAATEDAVFAATRGGLYRFNTDGWTRLALSSDPTAPPRSIDAITVAQQDVWVRTTDEVIRIRGMQASAFDRVGHSAIAVDQLGDVYGVADDGVARGSTGAPQGTVTTFALDVRPWIDTHCAACHGNQTQDFRDYDVFSAVAEDALARVRTGDMPRCTGGIRCPAEDRLTADEYAVLEQWIRAGLARVNAAEERNRMCALKPWLRGCAAALILIGAGRANAQTTEPPQCRAPAQAMSPQRLLRRLSLDLRGRIPSVAEIEAQARQSNVADALIRDYLDSDAFITTMRRHHEDLLWPNIDQIELLPDTHVLFPYPTGADGDVLYYSALRAAFVRAAGSGNLFLPCRDEPATFDANGDLVLEPVIVGDEVVAYQEGYVEVAPYWAPDTTIKVCALDAMPSTSGTVCPGPRDRYPFAEDICDQFEAFANLVQAPFRSTETPCDGPLSILAPDCGCGPDLRYCATPETGAEIRASLLEQELRIVDQVIRDDQPYDRVLTTKNVEFNGPVVHYLKYMSGLSFDTFAGIDETANPPLDLAYTDKTWVAVARSGRHSGVLTTPGYLLKFQTGRQRAHRYYNAFECASFIPSGPLPSPFELCSQRQDLTQRCGCDACHKTLEPMAAHWGRYADYGFLPMSESEFPTVVDARCTPPVDSVEQLFECFRFYELDPVGEEEAFAGYLQSYVFRTADDQASIDQGPSKLAADSLSSGRLDRCTVRRMWTQFMQRAPTLDEDGTVIPDLTRTYVSGGRSLKALVEAIVRQPAYGRQP